MADERFDLQILYVLLGSVAEFMVDCDNGFVQESLDESVVWIYSWTPWPTNGIPFIVSRFAYNIQSLLSRKMSVKDAWVWNEQSTRRLFRLLECAIKRSLPERLQSPLKDALLNLSEFRDEYFGKAMDQDLQKWLLLQYACRS
jgi:hypothetical protein